MSLVNLNKFFPRLPIRIKLAVAFAALATVPLLATGAVGTRVTLSYIEASAGATLDHDLQTAGERTERFLATVQEDIRYLATGLFEPFLTRGAGAESLDSSVAAFLRSKPSFIQVKLFRSDGELVLLGRASGRALEADDQRSGGSYYTYRAWSLERGEYLLLPVEIRGQSRGVADVSPIAAIAVVYPVHDSYGGLLGVAVGEAYAAKLFTALESGSPQLAGTTALVGADGRFLYHSERKNDWSSLLATSPDVNLATDFEADVAREIVSGAAGRLRVGRDRMVSFLPLQLLTPADDASLFLYRSVPISAIKRPARQFLWGVGTAGLVLLAVALALAVAAATQFTSPIYELREGTRRIAQGDFDHAISVETNDELEDLAADFTVMADRLREHTEELEALVASRTAELSEAHAELHEIIANSGDAIIRLDAGGRVQVWNEGAERLFGHAAVDAKGRDLNDLLLPPGPERRREATRIGRELEREGSFLDYHATRVRKDGTAVAVSLSQTVIRSATGEPLGSTLIIRDITQQKAWEKQMLRSERLSAAGRVAAGVAHEISNPIGIILNRLECIDLEIEDRCPNCFARGDFSVIRDQTERVGDVARRLLSIARDEPDERQPLDLNDLVGRVVHFLEPTFEKRGLHVEWDLADLPSLEASPQGIEIVVLNLLLNAVDASARQGAIGITTRFTEETGTVALMVSDSGCGIPPDMIGRVFEAFFTTKKHPKGTGLGLAVSRSVIQAHGGDISVVSEPEAGSCFTVTLPVQPKPY